MTTALIAKNKLHFINGALPRPDDGDLLFQAWIRCNSMVVSWIRNSISPQICSSIMYLDDARDIWSDLRDRFSICDSARIYQLRQKIMTLSQGSDDINNYFTNLRIVWDEYKNTQPVVWCTCATCRCRSATRWHDHQEAECVMQFLIGLNPSYSQIRSHILSMVPLPSLSKTFSLVLQEERQRSIEGNGATYNPLVLSEQPYSANAASSSFNRRLCSHCGRTNHTVDRCFVLHGFPPGFGKGKFKTNANTKEFGANKSINFVDDYSADLMEKTPNLQPAGAQAVPTYDQCQQLISLLQSQLATNPSPASPAEPQIPQTTQTNQSLPFTGTTLYLPFTANVNIPSAVWLLDTGATHHVCCNLSLFESSYPVQNA